MYCPYMRGKQFELQALRELSGLIKSNNLLPVIEPASAGSSALLSYEFLAKEQVPFVFLVNPLHGDLREDKSKLSEIIKYLRKQSACLFGYIVNPQSKVETLERFIKQFTDANKVIVHAYEADFRDRILEASDRGHFEYQIFIRNKVSDEYPRLFANGKKIILEDGFNRHRAKKNADFPQDEFFSDLHNIYKSLGFVGFGDFTIVGDQYGTGGPALAVALHLSYLKTKDGSDQKEVRNKHFVSDDTTGKANVAGKFLQALTKLVHFSNTDSRCFHSDALKDFQVLHGKRHYPSLGKAKEISMRHHIELMKTVGD